MTERKKLSDILHQGSDRERLTSLWKTTAAAAEFAPLPPGEYTLRILSGDLFSSKQKETPGYKLTLEVTEGEHAGRRVWHDFWLTDDATPITKRGLAKIGIVDPEQLEQPLPAGILIRGRLVLRTADSGNQWNELKYFECIGIEKGDAFEPKDAADQADDNGTPAAPEVNGRPTVEMFPFGANRSRSNGEADFLRTEKGGGKR